MESTWLGLELYFEHRNYLPTAYLFLPLALALTGPPRVLSWRARATIALLLLGVLATLSHLRAQLWSNPIQLEAYWAGAAPHSPRAANALARHYLDWVGDSARAREILDTALARHPHNALLVLSKLQLAIHLGTAGAETFVEAGKGLALAPIDGQALLGLRHIVATLMDPNASTTYRGAMRELLDRLSAHPQWASDRYFRRLLPYLRAQLALGDRRPDEAESFYREAIKRYDSVDSAMQIVAEMGSAGYYDQALRLLETAEALVADSQRRQDPLLDRETYAREIARIRNLLQEDRRTLQSKRETP